MRILCNVLTLVLGFCPASNKMQSHFLLSGMEARITRLEKELREKIGFKGEGEEEEEEEEEEEDDGERTRSAEDGKAEELEDIKRDELQGDETSSDGGIESGTDDLSEK